MKVPATALVVDAAILISAALGRSSEVVRNIARVRTLGTTDRAVEEARRRIVLGLRRPELLELLDTILEEIAVVRVEMLQPWLADSATYLRDAVPSGNGSTRDAHVLALAWDTGADIWSADRDFAGTGV